MIDAYELAQSPDGRLRMIRIGIGPQAKAAAAKGGAGCVATFESPDLGVINAKWPKPQMIEARAICEGANLMARSPEIVAAIRAVVEAFNVPRNRFGRLETHDVAGQTVGQSLQDHVHRVDQAMMVLQVLIGDKPVSILDNGVYR